eukprot:gene32489-17735_t
MDIETGGHCQPGIETGGHSKLGKNMIYDLGMLTMGIKTGGHCQPSIKTGGHCQPGIETSGHCQPGIKTGGHFQPGIETGGHCQPLMALTSADHDGESSLGVGSQADKVQPIGTSLPDAMTRERVAQEYEYHMKKAASNLGLSVNSTSPLLTSRSHLLTSSCSFLQYYEYSMKEAASKLAGV